MKLGRPTGHPYHRERGAVLGTEAIVDLVSQGWLFESSTFLPESLRQAGYDLRIAAEDLYILDPADPENPKPVEGDRFTLQPGQFAFVKTFERLCMPWTVAGNIAVRNRFALQGLLVLTGLLVDPGFGLSWNANRWLPKPEPLHFGIANVGASPITLVAERDEIASIQFMKVAGAVKLEEVPVPDVTSGRFAKGFLLFETLERRIEKVDGNVQQLTGKIDSIVIFGLYVVLATVFGGLLATFLGAIGSQSVSDSLGTAYRLVRANMWVSLVILGALLGTAVILASAVLWPIGKTLAKTFQRKKND